ncbi:hypothetical protein TSA6c_08545 [Azospirillum sp. TSA6c]|nr:hypothetical protein TSA6c_08545 [Azospirillum sp. TSA6c]
MRIRRLQQVIHPKSKRSVITPDQALDGGLPVPGEQIGEACGGVAVHHALQDVAQVGERLDTVELAGLCRTPNYAER